jgi:uncharacterized protein (DUF2147 family)
MMSNPVEIAAQHLYEQWCMENAVEPQWAGKAIRSLWMNKARAAIAALEAMGFKVVAREPTKEIKEAWELSNLNWYEEGRDAWLAAHAATPTPGR